MPDPVPAVRTLHHPIHDLLHKRWSPRAFADRPVDDATLGRLFEAARWAPSRSNEQPWRFIVGTSAEPELHALVLSCINEGNQRWARHAPVLMLACAQRLTGRGQPNAHAWYDLGQAVGALTLQAMALDLYLHQMGGFYPDKAREVFAIPDTAEAATAIALGYLGDPASLPEDLRVRELARSPRHPLPELIYGAKWGEAASFAR